MPPLFRADHVGSFLRTPEVLKAHEDFAAGNLSLEELREAEDKGILALIDMQKEIGLDVISDGEYRRQSWAGDFFEAVEGYVDGPLPITFDWRLPDGAKRIPGAEAAVADTRTVPMQSGRVVGERLRQKQRLTGHESAYMKQ